MRAGDIKKFLAEIISTPTRKNLDPQKWSINDPHLLNAFRAYVDGDPPEQIEAFIDGSITTERLTVERRVATLKLIKGVLKVMSKPVVTDKERKHLNTLLTSYFI